jgi:hypothetical protein
MQIINSMKQAWPFLQPVDTSQAPGYLDVVKKPMDLSLIEKKLNDGAYTTKELFLEDFNLMVNNCLAYNDENTFYVRYAKALATKMNTIMKRI